MERREYDIPLLEISEEQERADFPVTDTPKHYKDVFFLFLFGLNIVCIVSVALLYGIVALSSSGDEVIKVANNGKEYNETAEFTPSVSILLGMISTLAMAVATTAIWIFTLSRIASYVLNAIMISLILVPIVFGFVLFAMGFFVFGAALIALSIFLLVLSLFIRPRMDFAATNLKVACGAILQMPSIFGYALLAVGVQVLFSIVWGMAAVGYATSNNQTTVHSHGLIYDLDECTTYVYSGSFDVATYGTLTCTSGTCHACVCDGNFVSNRSCVTPKLYGWTYAWLLLSLFWTSAVISNVVHVTTSAAVAKWWTVGYPSALMVQEGFDAATTTSLGSICLGSLLVAVIRTLRTLLHFATRQLEKNRTSSGVLRQLQSCFTSMLKYFLTVMDRLVVYFNRYALCFVAIYRHDFRTASVAASSLFRTRGWSTLLNDDIIDIVLNIGHIIIGTTSMSVGYIYGRLSGVGHAYTVLLTIFGFAVGYLISIVALSTISSAVATVYVCYVDNPHALQITHPEMYVPLSECWLKVFPPASRQSPHEKGQPQASPSGDSSKFVEGPQVAGSTFEISFKDTNQPAQKTYDAPKVSRIRGTFGSSDNLASSGQSGATTAASVSSGAGTGSNAFSAGFAFLASIFPGPAGKQQPTHDNHLKSNANAGYGGGAYRNNTSVAGGGYASLPTTDPTQHAQDTQYNHQHTQQTTSFPFNRAGPWSAQGLQPQQQSKQQQGDFDSHAPVQTLFTPMPMQATSPHHQQSHHHSQQQHQHSRQQYQHQHQHLHQQQGDPMFSPQFASAINAIGAFTNTLQTSVFGANSGPPSAYGYQNNYAPSNQAGPGGTPSASLMSVDLEESFAV